MATKILKGAEALEYIRQNPTSSKIKSVNGIKLNGVSRTNMRRPDMGGEKQAGGKPLEDRLTGLLGDNIIADIVSNFVRPVLRPVRATNEALKQSSGALVDMITGMNSGTSAKTLSDIEKSFLGEGTISLTENEKENIPELVTKMGLDIASFLPALATGGYSTIVGALGRGALGGYASGYLGSLGGQGVGTGFDTNRAGKDALFSALTGGLLEGTGKALGKSVKSLNKSSDDLVNLSAKRLKGVKLDKRDPLAFSKSINNVKKLQEIADKYSDKGVDFTDTDIADKIYSFASKELKDVLSTSKATVDVNKPLLKTIEGIPKKYGVPVPPDFIKKEMIKLESMVTGKNESLLELIGGNNSSSKVLEEVDAKTLWEVIRNLDTMASDIYKKIESGAKVSISDRVKLDLRKGLRDALGKAETLVEEPLKEMSLVQELTPNINTKINTLGTGYSGNTMGLPLRVGGTAEDFVAKTYYKGAKNTGKFSKATDSVIDNILGNGIKQNLFKNLLTKTSPSGFTNDTKDLLSSISNEYTDQVDGLSTASDTYNKGYSKTTQSDIDKHREIIVQLLEAGYSPNETKIISELLFPRGDFNGEGFNLKQLPSSRVKDLRDPKEALNLLDLAEEDLDFSGFDPVFGKLRELNPLSGYDDTYKKNESIINVVKQIIGKGLEGGVLRAEDEKKYKAMLVESTDTPTTARNKINTLRKALQSKIQEVEQGFYDAGFDPYIGVSQRPIQQQQQVDDGIYLEDIVSMLEFNR